MQRLIDPASETVAQAMVNVESLTVRLDRLLSFVPDDKLAWAPSPSAKTALRIVGHCALTNGFFAGIISGTPPDPMPSPMEFLTNLHEADRRFTAREEVVSLLRESAAQLRQALEGVDARTIDSTSNSPFGPLPTRFWIDQCVQHLAEHTGQLTYLQTIWGDLDNHMG